MARNTTDITGQLLDTAGNITRIALNTFDPRDGSGSEVLRVLRETTAELAEASASPQAQEAFYRIVDTLTRLGSSAGAPLAVHPVSEPAQALLAALGDSLLPVLDAVEPAVEEFAVALGDLIEASSPLLPAAAGLAAGRPARPHPRDPDGGGGPARLVARTPPHRRRLDRRAGPADAAPGGPGRACGRRRAGWSARPLPPLADLTEAAAATTQGGPSGPDRRRGTPRLRPRTPPARSCLTTASRAGRVARAAAVTGVGGGRPRRRNRAWWWR